ncbi:hypothetical protein ACQ4PT_071701 [Festuca glaucescens]
MRVLGLLSLVAVIFLLSFRFLLHQQVLVDSHSSTEETEVFPPFVQGEGAARNGDDRRQHAKEWAEERKKMRWFMTKDYSPPKRHRPKHNRLL